MNKNNYEEYLEVKVPDVNKLGTKEPEYIGLKLNKENNKLTFIFPVNYYKENKIPEDKSTLVCDIKNLLKIITKTNMEELKSNYGEEIDDEFPFASYFWIIRDYLENGYYIETEPSYAKQDYGKINWKKTIRNNKFIVDNNMNIIYTEFIRNNTIPNENYIITQIHKYCVYEAVRIFGPIFYSIDSSSVKQYNLEDLGLDKENAISILEKEYINTYLDHKKLLLKNMIEMLKWLSGDSILNYDILCIYEHKFQKVFEKLICERFGNVESIEDYYPKGKWHIEENQKEEDSCEFQDDEESSSLREDSILECKEDIYILDAKYYKYMYCENKSVGRLPPTSDIAKQLIYGASVEKNKKCNPQKKKVHNIFLIPCNKAETEKELVEYVGYAHMKLSDEEKLQKSPYYHIHTIAVDLRSLVKNTLGNKEQNIKELVELVKKNEKQ